MNNDYALHSHEKRFLDASYDEPEHIGICCECFNKVYEVDEPFKVDDEYICDIECLAEYALKNANGYDFHSYCLENDIDDIEKGKKYAASDKYAFREWYQQEYGIERTKI